MRDRRPNQLPLFIICIRPLPSCESTDLPGIAITDPNAAISNGQESVGRAKYRPGFSDHPPLMMRGAGSLTLKYFPLLGMDAYPLYYLPLSVAQDR